MTTHVPSDKPTPRTPPPVKTVDLDLSQQWLTADLNVWSGPGEDFSLLDVIDEGRPVRATGELTGDWAQIVYAGDLAWVNAAYLAADKPVEEPTREPVEEPTQQPVEEPTQEPVDEPAEEPTPQPAEEPTQEPADDPTETPGDDPNDEQPQGSPATSAGLSGASCPDGSDIESGLTSTAVAVYRAVCAAFPAVTAWGGLRPGDDGDHGTGRALDIMVYGNSSLGQSIADYVQANASELGVSEILWSQHIWSVARASEGWRLLEDRGSTTANHYDHVHVSVN